MSPVVRFVLWRLAAIPAALFALITLSFGLVSLIPGDPVALIVGDFATPKQVAAVRVSLGLDKPLPQRYVDYLGALLHGDLGTSFFSGLSVRHQLLVLLPNTLVIIVPGLLLATLFGTAIGIAAAYFRRRWPDRFASGLITTAQSVPDFFLGLLLILAFYSIWRIAPAPVGILAPGQLSQDHRVSGSIVVDALITGSWATLASIAAHALLPALTIGVHFSSYFAKTVRTAMTQSMGSAQVEFARAHGLPERKVLAYALISARTPVLTYSALLFGSLLGASAIVETIFAWPGVGQWALAGTLQADIPVIRGFILLIGMLTMMVYLALDLAVMLLDPRVRSEQ